MSCGEVARLLLLSDPGMAGGSGPVSLQPGCSAPVMAVHSGAEHAQIPLKAVLASLHPSTY